MMVVYILSIKPEGSDKLQCQNASDEDTRIL